MNGLAYGVLSLLLLLAGCANFQAASEFATETTRLTATVRTEFRQLEDLCRRQAELGIVVDNSDEDGPGSPLKACAAYKASQGRLAEVTVDTLDAYAKALQAMADGKALDLAPEINKTSSRLAELKSNSGQTLLQARELGALTRLLNLLADAATRRQRDEAMRQLVSAVPDLQTNGRLLRSFFLPAADSPAGGLPPPYANLVRVWAASLDDHLRVLDDPKFVTREPLRTKELRLAARPVSAMFAARRPGDAKGVPAAVGAAIDAWLEALDSFSREALQSEASQLLGKLHTLREKALAARDAVQGESN